MDLETWRSLGEVAVFLALGGYAAVRAHRADKQTRGTGNGFAHSVRESLDRIEKKIDDHVAAHADAEIKRRP